MLLAFIKRMLGLDSDRYRSDEDLSTMQRFTEEISTSLEHLENSIRERR